VPMPSTINASRESDALVGAMGERSKKSSRSRQPEPSPRWKTSGATRAAVS
jgi:hypothetical protein